MKMISCLGATSGALYKSLNGLLWPSASSTRRSSTLARSLSVGRSSLTWTVPSNSSCSFWRTGVWLDGENGGVVLSGASLDMESLASWTSECEGGGEGGCCVAGRGAAMAEVVSEGSILDESVVKLFEWATARMYCMYQARNPAFRSYKIWDRGRSLQGGEATPCIRAERVKSAVWVANADSQSSACTG